MRLRSRLRSVSCAFALFSACGAPGDRTPGSSGARGPGAANATVPRADSSFYRGTRVRDLTSDGRADSAVLVARGSRPDSLDVRLTLFVDDSAVHEEAWKSEDGLIDIEPAFLQRPRLDSLVRAQFRKTLMSVDAEPIDTASLFLMAESPKVLTDIEPRPTRQVSISYGYETTVVLAWDAKHHRFVRLWSCC